MDKNEISMFVDAKMDLNEKKKDSGRFRNWTKCLIKIEAIKSFPCFLKVTFIRNVEDKSENICVTIHVPEVQIRLTNSRSKSYSYGLTWKHNRKRCHIFFAFECQISFEKHMKWFRQSLKNLELHRREILETRKENRDNASLLNFEKAIVPDKVNYSHTKNLQDILGPLPKIPDKRDSTNWFRRVSAMSGIYEEVFDSENIRRLSQTSGIYEEMKPPNNAYLLLQTESPPDLPLRSRINTFENEFFETVQRSNTNPESITTATKNKILLQGLQNAFFGSRSKRCESVSECKVSTPEELWNTNTNTKNISINHCSNINKATKKENHHIYLNINVEPQSDISVISPEKRESDLKKSRNSFSNSDLSKMTSIYTLPRQDNSISTSNIYEISQTTKATVENINKPRIESNVDNISFVYNFDSVDSSKFICNVSARITENFNSSINSSTVNLVGANINIKSIDTSSPPDMLSNILIDDISGYCLMAPIKTCKCFERIEKQKCNEAVGVFNHCILNDSDQENFDELIKVEKNESNINLSRNIEDLTKNSNQINRSFKSNLIIASNNQIENYYETPKKSLLSFDEKIPSYYPNCSYSKTPQKTKHSGSSSSYNIQEMKNQQKLYISSSAKHIKQEIQQRTNEEIQNTDKIKKIQKIMPIKACQIAENIYKTKKIEYKTSIHSTEMISNAHKNDQILASSSAMSSDESVQRSTISFGTLPQNIDFKFDNSKSLNLDLKKNRNSSQKCSKASLSTPKKYLAIDSDHCNKNSHNKCKSNHVKKIIDFKILTPELSSIKKITLPRFKKIDFSPLKLKINNVLQRNNSEGY